jgi:hypothetical protein
MDRNLLVGEFAEESPPTRPISDPKEFDSFAQVVILVSAIGAGLSS